MGSKNKYLTNRKEFMRKNFILYLLSAVLLLSSCDALDSLTQFNMDMSEEVTIDPTIPINVPFDIPTPQITLNTEKTFELNNTKKNLVQEIKLKNLSMTVTSPTGEDFSILNSIEIYIAADSLPEEKIAYLDNIPDSVSKIDLNTVPIDLKDYILKDNFNLRIKTKTDEVNTREYKIKLDARFWVNARILGI